MLAMPPKDPVSSTAVQHSGGVSNTHIRRVDHHAEIPRESYLDITTLERASNAPRFTPPPPHACAAPPNRCVTPNPGAHADDVAEGSGEMRLV
jgi:hypothetical protein